MPDLCKCLELGPLASELSTRRDKINASRSWGVGGALQRSDMRDLALRSCALRTYMTWGHPGLLEKEMQQ